MCTIYVVLATINFVKEKMFFACFLNRFHFKLKGEIDMLIGKEYNKLIEQRKKLGDIANWDNTPVIKEMIKRVCQVFCVKFFMNY